MTINYSVVKWDKSTKHEKKIVIEAPKPTEKILTAGETELVVDGSNLNWTIVTLPNYTGNITIEWDVSGMEIIWLKKFWQNEYTTTWKTIQIIVAPWQSLKEDLKISSWTSENQLVQTIKFDLEWKWNKWSDTIADMFDDKNFRLWANIDFANEEWVTFWISVDRIWTKKIENSDGSEKEVEQYWIKISWDIGPETKRILAMAWIVFQEDATDANKTIVTLALMGSASEYETEGFTIDWEKIGLFFDAIHYTDGSKLIRSLWIKATIIDASWSIISWDTSSTSMVWSVEQTVTSKFKGRKLIEAEVYLTLWKKRWKEYLEYLTSKDDLSEKKAELAKLQWKTLTDLAVLKETQEAKLADLNNGVDELNKVKKHQEAELAKIWTEQTPENKAATKKLNLEIAKTQKSIEAEQAKNKDALEKLTWEIAKTQKSIDYWDDRIKWEDAKNVTKLKAEIVQAKKDFEAKAKIINDKSLTEKLSDRLQATIWAWYQKVTYEWGAEWSDGAIWSLWLDYYDKDGNFHIWTWAKFGWEKSFVPSANLEFNTASDNGCWTFRAWVSWSENFASNIWTSYLDGVNCDDSRFLAPSAGNAKLSQRLNQNYGSFKADGMWSSFGKVTQTVTHVEKNIDWAPVIDAPNLPTTITAWSKVESELTITDDQLNQALLAFKWIDWEVKFTDIWDGKYKLTFDAPTQVWDYETTIVATDIYWETSEFIYKFNVTADTEPVNDAPKVTVDWELRHAQAWKAFTLGVSIDDTDLVSWSVSVSVDWADWAWTIVFNEATGKWDVTFNALNQAWEVIVTVKASDEAGNTTMESFHVTVDAPWTIPDPDAQKWDTTIEWNFQNCTVGVECQTTITMTDPDNIDPSSATVSWAPWATITNIPWTNDYIVKYTPTEAWNITLTVSATDLLWKVTTKEFNTTVNSASDTPVNDAPKVTVDWELRHAQAWKAFTLGVSIDDTDLVSWSVSVSVDWADWAWTIVFNEATGKWDVTFNALNQAWEVIVTVKASDEAGNTTMESFHVTVDAPWTIPDPDAQKWDTTIEWNFQNCTVGVECQTTITMTDPDNIDPSSATVSWAPWATITNIPWTNDYIVKYTPTEAWNITLTVSATDLLWKVTTKEFNTTVNSASDTPVNTPPVFTDTWLTQTNYAPWESWSYTFTATDADWDNLEFSDAKIMWWDLPNWIQFDQKTWKLTWDPSNNDANETYTISVKVNDWTASTEKSITFTVDAPVYALSAAPTLTLSWTTIVVTDGWNKYNWLEDKTYHLVTPWFWTMDFNSPNIKGVIWNPAFDGEYEVYLTAKDANGNEVKTPSTTFTIKNWEYQ